MKIEKNLKNHISVLTFGLNAQYKLKLPQQVTTISETFLVASIFYSNYANKLKIHFLEKHIAKIEI